MTNRLTRFGVATAMLVLALGSILPASPASASTTPDLKVAFIGDQGNNANSLAVLTLIKNENAQMVIHNGDFDYGDNPTAWDNNINMVLGSSFPYFASVGNHDVTQWPGYQAKLQQRLARVPGATCTGDLGVQSSCHYQGLFFILDGVGTLGASQTAQATYIHDQLAADNSVWSICSWHKNQLKMQIGDKTDEVGWGAYEECRQGGAIISTSHEHSYERTKTLTSMTNQVVDPAWPNPSQVRVAPGATFAFVSGLGGESIRDQTKCLPYTYPYGCNGEWANIQTSNQGVNYGALFCTFAPGGQENLANCSFKDIQGRTLDTFTITSQMGSGAPPAACADTLDNDGDGLIDFPADPGCASASDNDEFNAPPAACADGLDNDADGLTDYPNDPGCANASDNDETNAGGITLSASGRKVKGIDTVDLTWSGATGGTVDVKRNNVQLLNTPNDGAQTDNTGVKGAATFTYKVCNAGTTTCSNTVTVTF